MTEAQVQHFMSAIDSAEIKTFAFVDDITCYYKNGESGVCVYDSDNQAVVAINLNTNTTSKTSNPLRFMMCNVTDIHRAEVQGDYEQVKKFIDAYGLSLDDDQLKVLLTIDRSNTIVRPVTGDYTTSYRKLSKEEYNALSEEEKKKYDAKVKADQERLVGIPKGRAGIVIDNNYPMLNRSEYIK